jgi:hypothetical protein
VHRINLAQDINQCCSLFKKHERLVFLHVEEFLNNRLTVIFWRRTLLGEVNSLKD